MAPPRQAGIGAHAPVPPGQPAGVEGAEIPLHPGGAAFLARDLDNMAMGRLEIEQTPGAYISGTRARWLLQAGRAQMTTAGKLRLLASEGSGRTEPRLIWSAYSAGYHMNGDAINRG
jgi:hypothetical protein